jgi:hypothetical protein
MRKITIVIGLAAMLGGCMTMQERQQQAAEDTAYCRQANKTAYDKAKCVNAAERRQFGDSPLLAVKYAERLSLAVKIDKGEMSEHKAEAQFAAVLTHLQMQEAQQQQASATDFGNLR